MGQDDRYSASPESMPPQIDDIDTSWDDDQPLDEAAAPQSDDEEHTSADRITAIPSRPPEDFVAELMARADIEEADALRRTPVRDDMFDRPRQPTPPPRARDDRAGRMTRPEGRGRPGGLPTLPSEPPEFDSFGGSSSTVGEEHLPTHGIRRAATPPPRFTLPEPTQHRGAGRSADDLMLELDDSRSEPASFADAALRRDDHVALPELELDISEAAPTQSGDPSIGDMRDRYAMGDFTGALVLAESILETSPDDAEANRYAESCREVLTQMYAARLGQLSQIPSVATPNDQIRWLSLDHRAGFLLSLVDGASSLEEILDICGMARLDALRILFTLLEQRVIALEPG